MGFDLFKSVGKIASGVGGTVGSFANNAATVAGHAVGVLPRNKHITGVDWNGIDNVTNSIGNTVQKIPAVGPLFHGLLGIGTQPFSIAENILKGERIDHVAVDAFRQRIKSIREIAPYAQTVIAFVPGVGPAASSAIGAGLAIAEGLPADEVAMAAVAGAIPGGALALAAYKVGRTALVQHKVGGVAGLVTAIGGAAGVDIPPAATAALTGGLNALQAMANGTEPDKALIQSALQAAPGLAKGVDLSSTSGLQNIADRLITQGQSMIPGLSVAQRGALKNALHTGSAMQHAQNLQAITKNAIGTGAPLQHLLQVGQAHIASDPVAKAAQTALQGKGLPGFAIGTGLMYHITSPFTVSAVRKTLDPENAHGFDTAAALKIGRVTVPPPPPHTPAAVQAGRAIIHGARTAPADKQAALTDVVAATPATAQGGQIAIEEIAKAGRSWLLDAGIVAGGLILGVFLIGGSTGAAIGALAGGGADLIRRRMKEVRIS